MRYNLKGKGIIINVTIITKTVWQELPKQDYGYKNQCC